MTFNVCICGRPIQPGARKCEMCASGRACDKPLSSDDPLHIFDDMGDASQSSAETEPIRQPNRKHTGNRRNEAK